MHSRCLVLSAAIALLTAFAPAASAHTGGSLCKGTLAERGAEWTGECELPFQGFPIGVAGVYTANPANDPAGTVRDAEIHVELLAELANGNRRALGVECLQTDQLDVARCQLEDNKGTTDFTAPEALPAEIVSIVCAAHSHAPYSRSGPKPGGAFACWSSNEAREHLVEDKWFENNGFGPAPQPEPEPPAPGPLDPLSGAGLTGQIVTVPFNTYVPDTLVVSRSLGLTYTNLDTASHDVVAHDAKRPNATAAWCKDFEEGTCPLFWSELIGGGGTQTPVLGLQDAKVGESYEFYCSIHPAMRGTIQVAE